MSNLEKLNKVLRDVFDIKKIEDINDDMGPDEIEDWDSIGHVELITNLEEVFDIALNVVDISRMYTIGDIKKIVGKYGVEIWPLQIIFSRIHQKLIKQLSYLKMRLAIKKFMKM